MEKSGLSEKSWWKAKKSVDSMSYYAYKARELNDFARLAPRRSPPSLRELARRKRASGASHPNQRERRRGIIPCHPQDCRCGQCRAERPIIGYERREELVCDPATFHVCVTLWEKRGSHCQEEQGVATAPAPAKIVPKSKLSDEFIIEALARKYQQHTPVYRQCAGLADNHGIDLSRAPLTAGIPAADELLTAVTRTRKPGKVPAGFWRRPAMRRVTPPTTNWAKALSMPVA